VANLHDNEPNKPVHIIYLVGGLLFFYLLQWTMDWIWGYFTRSPSELYITVTAATIALVVTIAMFRNERVHELANEVAAELKKVTWPTGKDVKASTLVVVIMTIISAAILGAFDAVWSSLTKLIYG
jgi:preprotein translocase subunit SecE